VTKKMPMPLIQNNFVARNLEVGLATLTTRSIIHDGMLTSRTIVSFVIESG